MSHTINKSSISSSESSSWVYSGSFGKKDIDDENSTSGRTRTIESSTSRFQSSKEYSSSESMGYCRRSTAVDSNLKEFNKLRNKSKEK